VVDGFREELEELVAAFARARGPEDSGRREVEGAVRHAVPVADALIVCAVLVVVLAVAVLVVVVVVSGCKRLKG
jgi:hypothetical protein